MRNMRPRSYWLACAALLLADCGGAQTAAPEGIKDLAVATQPVNDSKCGGGLAFQTLEFANRTTAPLSVRPQCVSNTPGIDVVETPAVGRTLQPGESARFVCVLRDIGDPPDGRAPEAIARLSIRLGAAEQTLRIPVTCG
jgi:hypothetical protein